MLEGRAKNLIGGVVVAVLLAFPFVIPRIGRVDTWKILLALAGIVVIRYGDRFGKRQNP